MSKTFIISIEGDDNAGEFLQSVQDTKVVGCRKPGKRLFTIMPVLFIYKESDDGTGGLDAETATDGADNATKTRKRSSNHK